MPHEPIVMSPQMIAMMLSAIFGYFSSPVIALMLQKHWPTWLKTVISHICFFVIAALSMYSQGQLDLKQPVVAAITVLFAIVTGNVGHNGTWKQTGISDWIERKTTLTTNNESGEGQGYDLHAAD